MANVVIPTLSLIFIDARQKYGMDGLIFSNTYFVDLVLQVEVPSKDLLIGFIP